MNNELKYKDEENIKNKYKEVIQDRKRGMSLQDLTIKYKISLYDLHLAICLLNRTEEEGRRRQTKENKK